MKDVHAGCDTQSFYITGGVSGNWKSLTSDYEC